MARVWKEALCLGEAVDRYGRKLKFDRPYLRQFHANAAKLLSRGVPVPCTWEHQAIDAGSPAARLAAYAKYTFGHLAGVRFNGRGNVEVALEVPDEADRQQLKKTRFVSPKIFNGFRDSKGGVYSGPTVGHVAATPTPVQFGQKPFELGAGESLYLSFTPEGSTVADENDDKDKGDKGGKKKADAGGDSGGNSDLASVIDALRECQGMNIPDEVSDWKGLVIAIKACGDMGGGGKKPGEPDEDDGDLDLDGDTAAAAGGGVGGSGAPMLMSDERAKPLAEVTRKELKGRIERLYKTGRATRFTAEKLWISAKAVELSFTPDADLVPNKFVTKVETLEKMPEWSAWKKTGEVTGTAAELSDGRTAAVDRPNLGSGVVGPTADLEATIKRQEELAAGLSHKPKKAAAV